MCGIVGYYSENNKFSKSELTESTRALINRGPDAEGYFYDDVTGLGHRRLSVIDLSESANQPMYSPCGRYVIVYNGEVYNFREIAKMLAVKLRTSSDTEVILQSFIKWGTQFVSMLNGMFAIVIYDKQERKLHLFRDRIGIKPLYYYWDGDNFAFASELKALMKFHFININKRINDKAINQFLYLGYIPEPDTIYRDIYKFPSGSYALFYNNNLKITPYWNIKEKIRNNTIDNYKEAKQKLNELINDSVRYRLISDVPYGTFLSGGTDSSLVTAVAQKLTNNKLKTFSIGFKESKYNESGYAKAVAEYLGTEHHEFIVSYKDAIELVDEITDTYDEPYADSSAIPTMLVSKLAKKYVTMTLSGDGGDELFYGYGANLWAKRLSNPFIKQFRKPLKSILSCFLNCFIKGFESLLAHR